jgi:hypothetical protein
MPPKKKVEAKKAEAKTKSPEKKTEGKTEKEITKEGDDPITEDVKSIGPSKEVQVEERISSWFALFTSNK